MIRTLIVILATLPALGLIGCSNHPASSAFSIADLDGESHQPLRTGLAKASVVIFITTDCPIANKYCPEIARIRSDYDEKQVKIILAHVDPDITPAAARTHASEYGLPCPIVIDAQHYLVKETGATRTPEAVVITGEGHIAYRGRINDQFQALGDRKNQIANHDLRAALDAILAGEEVKQPRTEAVGCVIPTW